MSYDGGLEIRILNPELGKLIQEFKEKEPSLELWEHHKYDLSYRYLDCAYVTGCPDSIKQAHGMLIDLLEYDFKDKEVFYEFVEKYNSDAVRNGYSYFKWVYYPSDDDENYDNTFEDEVEFEYGEKGKRPRRKKEQEKIGLHIREIFPFINNNAPTGLIQKDGCLTDCQWSLHKSYLGENDCLYLPEYITAIDPKTNAFNSPGWYIEKFVITTNFEKFPSHCWCMRGFEELYIIDADTKKVVCYANGFVVDGFICNESEFEDLIDEICEHTAVSKDDFDFDDDDDDSFFDDDDEDSFFDDDEED